MYDVVWDYKYTKARVCSHNQSKSSCREHFIFVANQRARICGPLVETLHKPAWNPLELHKLSTVCPTFAQRCWLPCGCYHWRRLFSGLTNRWPHITAQRLPFSVTILQNRGLLPLHLEMKLVSLDWTLTLIWLIRLLSVRSVEVSSHH